MATKPPASPRTFGRTPISGLSKDVIKEAWGLFVFSAMFAVLFDLFFAYGIELRVLPVKKTGVQEIVRSSPTPVHSPGWGKQPTKTAHHHDLTPPPSNSDNFPRLSINGVRDRFEKGTCVFLDARKPEEYLEGHIPGALNLFGNELEKFVPVVVPQLPDKEKEIVAYCHGGDCDLSLQVAKALSQAGYTHVEIFEGGWPDWKKAALPVHTGETP
jgi:rhodanese-related sulfurtransferase